MTKTQEIAFLVSRGIPFDMALVMSDEERHEYVKAFLAQEENDRRK